MHSHCFGAYTRYAYTCPVCWKSLGDMGVYWRMLDSLLESGGWRVGGWGGGRAGQPRARVPRPAWPSLRFLPPPHIARSFPPTHPPTHLPGTRPPLTRPPTPPRMRAERLPPEYASRRQGVSCNDCGRAGEAPFHFVYHKCEGCGSYNTRVGG